MANTQSAKKAIRSSKRKARKNRIVKKQMREQVKSVRALAESGDAKTANESFPKAASVIDQAAKKGVIHKNTASRYKSRLARRVQSAGKK